MKKIIFSFTILAIAAIAHHAPSHAHDIGEAHSHEEKELRKALKEETGEDNFDEDDVGEEGLEGEKIEQDTPRNENARERRKRQSQEARDFRNNTRERRRAQKEEIKELRKNRGPFKRD